jgi:hypothetical protein
MLHACGRAGSFLPATRARHDHTPHSPDGAAHTSCWLLKERVCLCVCSKNRLVNEQAGGERWGVSAPARPSVRRCEEVGRWRRASMQLVIVI